jgi:hypothetical protein
VIHKRKKAQTLTKATATRSLRSKVPDKKCFLQFSKKDILENESGTWVLGPK